MKRKFDCTVNLLTFGGSLSSEICPWSCLQENSCVGTTSPWDHRVMVLKHLRICTDYLKGLWGLSLWCWLQWHLWPEVVGFFWDHNYFPYTPNKSRCFIVCWSVMQLCHHIERVFSGISANWSQHRVSNFFLILCSLWLKNWPSIV